MRDGRPSAKQRAARERNWRVFKLRGLQSQLGLLTGPRRVLASALIDRELEAIGAKPRAQHEAEQRAEFEAEWAATHKEQSA